LRPRDVFLGKIELKKTPSGRKEKDFDWTSIMGHTRQSSIKTVTRNLGEERIEIIGAYF
jgi:hypothetical protein